MTPNFLTLAEILEVHRDQIVHYGGSLELRDAGLLEAARAMPEQSFDGQYLHSDLPTMAAAYLYHLVKNHSFVDGNKRVGAAAAVVFLHLNDLRLSCTQDEYFDLTLGVADSSISKDEAAEFFRRHVTS